MMAMQGSIALKPTIEAIKAKKIIGLANKEVLVAAGDLINKLKKEYKSCIIPVDSEHSAIFQCLKNENENEKTIKRLILTASGGPFLNLDEKKLKNISLEDALHHPNFSMGKKITVDSSTMMNKGLEIIEAYHLFNINKKDIDVIVHPEQIIHSMVEFQDSSILAQMSEPTMDIPISYALSYPKREKSMIQKFDFIKNSKFTFYEPDLNKFLCLKLAQDALNISKSMPCFMNMANEILVKRFLNNKISWLDISNKLEKLMSFHSPKNMLDLKDILDVEEEAYKKAITI
nr:1-deoxy-D-xylulose 5-phosphate reductoisomerase [Candidatus Anoxychlamydiales bacterium]